MFTVIDYNDKASRTNIQKKTNNAPYRKNHYLAFSELHSIVQHNFFQKHKSKNQRIRVELFIKKAANQFCDQSLDLSHHKKKMQKKITN